MWDYIVIAGLIIGILLIALSNKKQLPKYVKSLGIIITVVCVIIALPDFVHGFIAGFTDAAKLS